MKKITLLLILLFIISCNDEKTKTIVIEPSQKSADIYKDKERLHSLEKRLSAGDTLAYDEYEMISGLSGHEREFLYYSLRMAEEFNYHKAYFKTYYIMSINASKLKSEHYNKLKVYYLLKAYELGNEDAIDDVTYIFPDGNIPNSEQYWGK